MLDISILKEPLEKAKFQLQECRGGDLTDLEPLINYVKLGGSLSKLKTTIREINHFEQEYRGLNGDDFAFYRIFALLYLCSRTEDGR